MPLKANLMHCRISSLILTSESHRDYRRLWIWVEEHQFNKCAYIRYVYANIVPQKLSRYPSFRPGTFVSFGSDVWKGSRDTCKMQQNLPPRHSRTPPHAAGWERRKLPISANQFISRRDAHQHFFSRFPLNASSSNCALVLSPEQSG